MSRRQREGICSGISRRYQLRVELALALRYAAATSALDLVFMDTTSLYFEGAGGQTLGQHGYSKDHRPDLRQMILAVLLDGDGRPVCSEMWPGNTAERDLTPEEKKVIMDAVALSLRNPGSAKYHWAKFPAVVTEGSVNYCATVDAQSPYAAYSGRQAYVVEAQMSGNRVSSAVVGLIAGGKDFALVTNMCAKYGLDPRNAG
jgi:hypothetical protein